MREKSSNTSKILEEIERASADTESKPSIHFSLTANRNILVVDEEGPRRQETVDIVQKILLNADIDVAASPEQALAMMKQNEYDTFVVNLLMPGYSSSEFVKEVHNHSSHPLIVGFSADKMSDAYDPKKGIKVKPLRKLFEKDSPPQAKSQADNSETKQGLKS
jgi:PleD family two-component response regulator